MTTRSGRRVAPASHPTPLNGRLARLGIGLALMLAACNSSATPSVGPSDNTAAASATGPEASAPALPAAGHVYLIIFENKDYASVIGSRAAPYLNSLAAQYALATNYHGVAHPSQPNYLALFSGSTQGITDDGIHDIAAPNLADQIESAGLSWRVYAEDVPSGCYTDAKAGTPGSDYTRKHNPAISFLSIRTRPDRCRNITDFEHFDPAAANFSFIVPNSCHDMHDCPVADGDAWLKGFLPEILGSAMYTGDGAVFITFDEGRGNVNDGEVAALAVSPFAQSGARSAVRYDHYSMLRTVQELLGLPCLAHSCAAQPMGDLLGVG